MPFLRFVFGGRAGSLIVDFWDFLREREREAVFWGCKLEEWRDMCVNTGKKGGQRDFLSLE